MSAGILRIVPNQCPLGTVINWGEECLSVSVRTGRRRRLEPSVTRIDLGALADRHRRYALSECALQSVGSWCQVDRDRTHSGDSVDHLDHRRNRMIVLGIILLIIGFVAGIAILWTIGIIVLVIGLALALLGMAGHAVGGRRHYY